MDIPSQLKIIGKVYDVKMNPTCVMDDGTASLGFHRGALNLIEINPSYPQQTQESTLLHEILEAINHLLSLELEHRQINVLEETLYQVLRDNELNFGE